MADILKAACIQMTSGPDIQRNLEKAEGLIRQAAGQGAQLVTTPEVTDQMLPQRSEAFYSHDQHPAVAFFGALAQELKIFLLIGSIAVKAPENNKAYNRSLFFGPDGTLKASYDKIHLFDAELPCGEIQTESKTYQPGDCALTVNVPPFTLGMSICYDLRFAHLYRDLAKAGANVLCVPAAFTVSTGRLHWEVLLRARAIETGSYVLAPAQWGTHDGGRRTYGHSMIIDPWGQVLAQKDQGEGVIMDLLDIQKVREARSALPALQHDRAYTLHKI